MSLRIEGDKIRSGYITPAFVGADCLVRGGKNRHGWGMVKKRCPAHARLSNTPPLHGALQRIRGNNTQGLAGALKRATGFYNHNQGLSFREKRGGGFVTLTERNIGGDALCFMVKTWARHKTTETVFNNGWQLVAVCVGGWRLVVLKG